MLRNTNLADINPIGGISKTDLKKFIAYARDAFELPILTKYATLFQRKTDLGFPMLIDPGSSSFQVFGCCSYS